MSAIKTLIPSNPKFVRQLDNWDSYLQVSEFFSHTIQGEGINIGKPAVFLRMQSCTMNCVWCDTASVWRQGNPYSFEELFELMETHGTIDFLRDGASLVLTGGSPLLQQKELADFLDAFFDKYDFMPYVEVENECTLVPNVLIPYVACWNNSPKLSNSGNVVQLRYKPEVLKKLNHLENSWFKFVIRNENDWQEIVEDFISTGYVSKHRIILMPVGGSREELNKNAPTVVDIAIRNNVRYCSREHVQLWDTLTGV